MAPEIGGPASAPIDMTLKNNPILVPNSRISPIPRRGAANSAMKPPDAALHDDEITVIPAQNMSSPVYDANDSEAPNT